MCEGCSVFFNHLLCASAIKLLQDTNTVFHFLQFLCTSLFFSMETFRGAVTRSRVTVTSLLLMDSHHYKNVAGALFYTSKLSNAAVITICAFVFWSDLPTKVN